MSPMCSCPTFLKNDMFTYPCPVSVSVLHRYQEEELQKVSFFKLFVLQLLFKGQTKLVAVFLSCVLISSVTVMSLSSATYPKILPRIDWNGEAQFMELIPSQLEQGVDNDGDDDHVIARFFLCFRLALVTTPFYLSNR